MSIVTSKHSAESNDATSVHEPSAVETMLNRPVRQLVWFICQCASTWLRGLFDPWRLGKAVASNDCQLAPPFAFLVAMFFLTGVSMRLWRAMALVTSAEHATLLEDLKMAVGNVSLPQAILMTFPCVLVVGGGARLLSIIFRGPRQFEKDGLVTAACFAVGWQAGLVVCVPMLFMFLQCLGYDTWDLFQKDFDKYGVYGAGLVVLWGALIITPTLRLRLPSGRWWPMPVAVATSFGVIAAMLLGSMCALTATADLSTAARTRIQREYDALIGDMHINVLQTKPIATEAETDTERYELTIAYSSRAKQVLVIPHQKELQPPDQSHAKFGDCQLRVVSSSLDDLDDGALIVDPGQTRVATYIVEIVTTAEKPTDAHKRGKVPYKMDYHRREPDGFFSTAEAVFWAPGEFRR